MSELLWNINSIISAFNSYAKEDGDCTMLSKGKLKRLIQKEFAEVIMNPHDPMTIEMVLQLLDQDHNGKVDFEEFAVLVFKVARACYKKTRPCEAGPAEGQSSKAERHTTCQDKEVPMEKSTCPSAQELEGTSEDGEPERSSEEQKQETPKSERCTEGQPKDSLVPKDLTSQLPGKPLVACSCQRESNEKQVLNKSPAHPAACAEEKAEQKPQSAAEEGNSQSVRKTFAPDQDTRELQGCTTQQSPQPCQIEKQGHTGQKEATSRTTEQEQTTQLSTQEAVQTPEQRETNKTQRQEQDATNGKPQKSQEATQKPHKRSTCQSIPDPQTEQALLDHQVERAQTSEPSSTHQPQTGEDLTQRQESKPWTQERVPKFKAEEKRREELMHESSQQTENNPGQEQAKTGQRKYGSLTTGHLTDQLEGDPQESEKTAVDQQKLQSSEQSSTIHEGCQSLASEQCKPSLEQENPQNSVRLGQSQHHECSPQTPKECPSQEEAMPQMPSKI